MKELVVLSGKGGTGKTAVTAALAHQASLDPEFSNTVIVDADVDAANLELVVGARRVETHEFEGSEVASIDPDLCLVCGTCQEVCRFEAISFSPTGQFEVDPMGCEGCATCFYQCPVEAIQMTPRKAGQWFVSDSRFGSLLHARLRPAQENSGKLVARIRETGRKKAVDQGSRMMVVDGPPGIACPALAAVTGADLALIVTEPTGSGLHDLKRAREMVAHFRIPTVVCINKADINPDGADAIEDYCRGCDVPLLGRIPFDPSVPEAMAQARTITELDSGSPASEALLTLWPILKDHLEGRQAPIPLKTAS